MAKVAEIEGGERGPQEKPSELQNERTVKVT
jgi:hypothetical protein